MSREHWILTASGKRFYYDDVRSGQFDITDIAVGLSRNCRYNGQLTDSPELEDEIYVVAQHSVYAYWFLRDHVPNAPREALPWALLHDAVEAYYTDIPSPLKGLLGEYKAREHEAEMAFIEQFGIPYNQTIQQWVKYADIQILWAESQEMCAIPSDMWDVPGNPEISLRDLDPFFCYWRPKQAKEAYLNAFEEIKPLLEM